MAGSARISGAAAARPPRLRAAIALITFIAVTAHAQIDWSLIRSPPRLVNAPDRPQTVYFSVEKMLSEHNKVHEQLLKRELRCTAEGNPTPTYSWTKNGKPFDLSMYTNTVAQTPREGTLTFVNLQDEDAGIYQCHAKNDNGTAVAAPIRLTQTWIRHFPETKPVIVTVELGEPFSRNCTPPASTPHARVYWILKSDEPGKAANFQTINNSHVSSNDEGTLFFHYVHEQDKTEEHHYYTCTAENTELHDYKFGNKFQLSVLKQKRRELSGPVAPQEQYVNQSSPVALEGTTHKLHCFFSGHPLPQVKWSHNGMAISDNKPDNGGFRFEQFGRTLAFNVTKDKQGMYKCEFPQFQDMDRQFTVMVEAAPYWPEGPPPNTNTSEGETVTFDCTTMGKPTPTVTFYKNGVELKTSSNNRYVITGNKLTIYDVKKGVHDAGDNAVYQCKAENKHGYVWTNFYLNLLAFKPQLLTDPGEVEAVIGKDVTLECKFFGSPNADITWTSNQLPGTPHNVVKANAHGVGKLVLTNVNASAEGEYTCTGKNKYGEASGAARLAIRKRTELPPFDATEEVRTAGAEIRLPCSAQADDRLDVQYEWKINGEPLSGMHLESGHYVVGEDNSLIVGNPASYDSAKYTCIAKTKLDQAEKSISIKIKDVPMPAYSITVEKCDSNSRSAEIVFEHIESKDNVSPVKEFWVQYQIDGSTESGMWNTHNAPVQAPDVIENNERVSRGRITLSLQPFGEYKFRVFARNEVGDSTPISTRSQCVTAPKKPDRNPAEVAAQGASPENLVVSWKPMQREDWNGANFHYRVKYRPADSSESDWKEADVNDPYASKFTIDIGEDDARPFQPYLVQVQAVNDEGTSSVIPEVVQGRTGEGIPSAIVEGFMLSEKSGESATFKWQAIDPAGANGNFTGYKVYYWSEEEEEEDEYDYEEDGVKEALFLRRKKRSETTILLRSRRANDNEMYAEDGDVQLSRKKWQVFGPAATSGTVYGLMPASTNKAYITVLNGAHEGPKSQIITFRTDDGVPTPVRGLGAYPMNARSEAEKAVVVVRWNRPKNIKGKLMGYLVRYCRTEGRHVTADCEEKTLPKQQREVRLTGLEYEQPYRFIVRAIGSVGEGERNSADAKTLPEQTADGVEPEVPSAQIGQITDTAFNVSFVPGEFDDEERRPVGNYLAVQYREADTEEWKEKDGRDDSLTVSVDELTPGTRYEVRTVAVERTERGEEQRAYSPIQSVTTTGKSPRSARLWLLFLILLILLLLLLICCIVCVACRHRGEHYPVSEREREQGREPILGKQHFGEYKSDDDEKKSLTGSKAESETDSMAEYGDNDPGRFTEDGSFIGQYVPNKTLIAQGEPTKGSTSTFV